MGERRGDGRAGLAVGQNGRGLEMRMSRDQAQQFAGHVAGAAEHDGGYALGHAPATFDSPACWMPSLAIR